MKLFWSGDQSLYPDSKFRYLSHVGFNRIIAGSLESANSSILASCDHFKEVVGKKIRVL